MKNIAWIVLGLGVAALAGFAALWLWGSWAFSPRDQPHVRLIAEGALDGGAGYRITSEGRTFAAPSYCVIIATEQAPQGVCAVFVEVGGPPPTGARTLDADHIAIDFERALADGSRVIATPLAADGLPTETVSVAADGTTTRTPAPAY
ncbi:MAG: hypothetical protein JNM59_10705 [Hyphomonadaceae bacterium]|nr:hypothetical protein [Hyphomonadaceae bacterium]